MQSDPSIMIKSFVFSQGSIRDLKAQATSERVPKPTRFEALAGFIWEQAFAAATHNLTTEVEHTELFFAVGMRHWLSPPLPKESMGNLFIPSVRATTDKSSRLQVMVEKIHLSLSNVQHKIATVYQGENRVDALLSDRKAEISSPIEFCEGQYRLTSLCNTSFKETDFGFGKPVRVVHDDGRQPLAMFRNLIILTDFTHPITGDGMVEACINLEEKDMTILESNPHFLAFASPL
ncbi:hypothetical protein SOVF_078390 [Spinacia oleracea]|nr:hypothetical protein SOVF_078390 [Spinacia oleracea]